MPLHEVAALRDPLRRGRLSRPAADRRRDPQASSSSSATTGRRRPSSTSPLRSRAACTEPAARRDVPPHPRRGRGRPRPGGQITRRRSWYRGFVAEEIVRFQAREWLDSSGERHAGLLAEDDLREWAPSWEEPLSVDYHGYEVFKAGPWSQAPVFLQQLRLLEGFDLAAHGPREAEYIHTITECAKLAFADREAWYGDPDFTDVPLDDAALARLRGGAARGCSARSRRPSCGRAAKAGTRGSPRRSSDAPLAPGVGEPNAGRHRPPRRRRPLGEHGLGDAERRLALGRAGHPVARLLPRHARADVLARGGPAELARAGEATAHDALADDGRARRRALPRARHARRRPAGPVDAPRLPRPRPLRPRPPGRDRRAEPPHRGVPVELLSARDAARGTSRSRSASARRRSRAAERGHEVEVSGPWSLGRVSSVAREPDGILKAGANPRGQQGYAAGR